MAAPELKIDPLDKLAVGGSDVQAGQPAIRLGSPDTSPAKCQSSDAPELRRPNRSIEVKMAQLLREYLQPDSQSSLDEVTTAILAGIPSNGSYSTEAFDLSQLCVDIAVQIPYHQRSQRKLALLCRCLSQSPKLKSATTVLVHTSVHLSAAKFQDEEKYRSWKVLGEVIRENLQGPDAKDTAITWVNYHAFLAHLESTGIWSSNPTYAVWAMREAFENEAKDEAAWERECLTMAAAQWILWNGQAFFQDILDHQETCRDYDRILAFGCLYQRGGAVLSLDRWHFWKDGFAAAARHSDYSHECKMLASKARGLMIAMEKNILL